MTGLAANCIFKQNKARMLSVLVVFVCLTFVSSVQASPFVHAAVIGKVTGADLLNEISKRSSEYRGSELKQDSVSDNLVLVVSSKNPINTLSKKEVIDIYMGRYKTFPDSRLAEAIDYPAGSTVKQRFYSLLVDRSERKINAYWSRLLFSGRATPPKSTKSPAEVASELINNPNGLAYMPEHAVTTEMKIVYRL